MTPRMLPKAELKIAAASFPPTALVKITADETGGGMQLSVSILINKNNNNTKTTGKSSFFPSCHLTHERYRYRQ